MSTTDKSQGDIEELLPWHATGTLGRRDAQRVEDALQRDPDLARRYALVRDELGETIALNESLGAPSSRAMDNLFARIDAEPARAARSPGFGVRFSEFVSSLSPRTLALAGGAAAIAILLQAGIIAGVVLKERSAGGYVTASRTVADTNAGAFVLIRFAPQATQDEVTKFLEADKMTIVAGPTSGGLYKVKISPTPLPQAELGAIVKRLQDNKVVGFIASTQ
ncbi:MAG TPA: hypothetical protein VNR39_09595 [Pseudolabrys sp.]|nr:hypothetical protein [Pseudolabrys sp.]